MSLMVLFTHLKIILLQYFSISIFSFQLYPKQSNIWKKRDLKYGQEYNPTLDSLANTNLFIFLIQHRLWVSKGSTLTN